MREGEDEGENPIHDMPWHVATLYEDWAQYIVHLHFIFFGRGLIYHAHSKSVIARKRPVRRAIPTIHFVILRSPVSLRTL